MTPNATRELILFFTDSDGNTIHQKFDGTSKQIQDKVENYFKTSGGKSFLKSLFSTTVATTPYDPIAGNPSSYMARLINNNFNLATTTQFGNGYDDLNLFSINPSFKDYSAGDNDTTVKQTILPLRDTYYLSDHTALIFDMPITLLQADKTSTYTLTLGFGVAHQIIDSKNFTWSILPSLHAGATGSMDLGSATILYDGAVANRLTVPYQKFTFGYTNDLSWLQTQSVNVGDIEIPYDIENWATQNGLDMSYHINSDYIVGGYYTRMDILSGQRWYIPSSNEVGVKFNITNKHNGATYNQLTASLGYLTAIHEYKGITASIGFNF
jgi:phage-related protein